MTASVARLAPLPASEWTDRERELLRGNLARADRFLSLEHPTDAPLMPPILGLLARHPRLGSPWLAFSAALTEPRSGARTRVAHPARGLAHRTYLWDQHMGMAETAGLTPQQVAALRGAADAQIWTDAKRDLLRVADQLIDDHVIDDTMWNHLESRLDEHQLLEVPLVVGSYVCAKIPPGIGLTT